MYISEKNIENTNKNNISWLTKEALTCILIHNN